MTSTPCKTQRRTDHPSRRRGNGRLRRLSSIAGLSAVEVALLAAVITLALFVSAPLFFRGVHGQVFFGSVRSLDRQFDPYDPNASQDFANTISNSAIHSVAELGVGMPGASLFAVPVGGEATQVGTTRKLTMGFVNLPSGEMPRPSMGADTIVRSNGRTSDSYNYRDQLR